MTEPAPRPLPHLSGLVPYKGGTGGGRAQVNTLKLSANESPLGPSPRAIEAYRAAAGALAAYPDSASGGLRGALAESFGLAADWIACGAGSDELLGLLIAGFAGPGDEVLISERTFMMYEISARAHGAGVVKVPDRDYRADVDALLGGLSERTRIVFLANPNNPTGTYLPGSEVRRLHRGLPPHVLLVVDAAYAEYVMADDYESGLELVSEHRNVVMTRTFSKIHGLAALRVGWAYAPAGIVSVIDRVRGPFNVSTPAQEAAIASLGDLAHLEAARAHNARMLPWLTSELEGLGFTVVPSAANFVLAAVPGGGAASAALEAHLQGEGIHIRRFAGEGLEGFIRVTIGTRPALERFLAATKAFLAAKGRS
ncbi:MAG: histidinol-phosphate transaminase [Alphaproteobacteria bacterium]|nr:histidinol-phosphate transaminase [Alphaproteobacteria bacterium]